jgi:hypothetical protein
MKEPKDLEKWLALRKEAGLLIDPMTAKVNWKYGIVGDPYNIGDIPKEEQCIGRQYFARAPGSEVWVAFDDLPDEVRGALWEKHESTLAFPAGLPRRYLTPAAGSAEDGGYTDSPDDLSGVLLIQALVMNLTPEEFWTQVDELGSKANALDHLDSALKKLAAIQNAAPG